MVSASDGILTGVHMSASTDSTRGVTPMGEADAASRDAMDGPCTSMHAAAPLPLRRAPTDPSPPTVAHRDTNAGNVWCAAPASVCLVITGFIANRLILLPSPHTRTYDLSTTMSAEAPSCPDSIQCWSVSL
jgi:hypothetical protein